MKISKIINILIVLIVIAFLIFVVSKSGKQVTTPITEETPSVLGCYVAHISQDVYTLEIESQNGSSVSGDLEFDNFEKDSSSGTFVGTYENGILLGDYSFQSEGTFSVMQVIFQKTSGGFVRGYGPVDAETGTRFTDLNAVTFDASSPLSLFSKEACGE